MVRLTAAQAATRYLSCQLVDGPAGKLPYFAGVWAIFGHGNVAAMGEALHATRDVLPTFRAHNEQGMAHAAIAFAKQSRRRRAMICTSSIGPGATNMVTAAALAHVNRLPILFLPGDVYAGRRPDPVLQQVEDFHDGTVSANDCFKPVSRYFDRITRPEQLLDALPKAMATMLDPASCGPVTLAFCQDVQAEAWDFPDDFLESRIWSIRAPRPSWTELDALEALIRKAKAPLIIAGGGVLYAGAEDYLARFAERLSIPVGTTQSGKGAMVWQHPLSLGGIGVTGTSAANEAAARADLIIGIGTRLQDFTTGSRSLFGHRQLVQINVAAFDAHKHGAVAVVGDAREVLEELLARFVEVPVNEATRTSVSRSKSQWDAAFEQAAGRPEPGNNARPSDAQILGAVWRSTTDDTVITCAAGGLPGELHKLWPVRSVGSYHLEYGYSCMGYEIAGGIGVKLAEPTRPVVVLVGDGSYLMMNSELATAVAMRINLTIVIVDNRGFGCIDRLQRATGNAPFNNLLRDDAPQVDFVAHAASLGASSEKVGGIEMLEAALGRAQQSAGCRVIVIDADPALSTEAGGTWWDVAIPEISEQPEVQAARANYDRQVAAIKKGEEK